MDSIPVKGRAGARPLNNLCDLRVIGYQLGVSFHHISQVESLCVPQLAMEIQLRPGRMQT